MGRPRKVTLSPLGEEEARPDRKFNPDEPCAVVVTEDGGRFIAQGDAYYSYAEPIGPYDERRLARKLIPPPRFVGWQDEITAEREYKKFRELQRKIAKDQQDLADMKVKLDKFKILEDAGGAPD